MAIISAEERCAHETCECTLDEQAVDGYCSLYCENAATGDEDAPGSGCACRHERCRSVAGRSPVHVDDASPIAMGGGPGALSEPA